MLKKFYDAETRDCVTGWREHSSENLLEVFDVEAVYSDGTLLVDGVRCIAVTRPVPFAEYRLEGSEYSRISWEQVKR